MTNNPEPADDLIEAINLYIDALTGLRNVITQVRPRDTELTHDFITLIKASALDIRQSTFLQSLEQFAVDQTFAEITAEHTQGSPDGQ